MAQWLVKQEPEEYPYAQLVADGSTLWEGVSNPLALKHLRAMKAGENVFYYHTGKEKAIVAIATVESAVVDEDNVPRVTLSPKKLLKTAVTLSAIKADPQFAEWELVKQARLSVMPVSKEIWKAVLDLSEGK
jgi:predicted RNA-binding protein with PUA-like domain